MNNGLNELNNLIKTNIHNLKALSEYIKFKK